MFCSKRQTFHLRLASCVEQPRLSVIRPGGCHAIEDDEVIRRYEDELPQRESAFFIVVAASGVTGYIGEVRPCLERYYF